MRLFCAACSCPWKWLCFLSWLAIVIPRATGDIGPDGLCKITLFAPFSDKDGEPVHGLNQRNLTVGYSSTAAALLAADHFNNRMNALVPELENLTDCNVQLEISKVFDSQGNNHAASKQFWEFAVRNNSDIDQICAIAGPANDVSTRDIGVMAHAQGIPLVSTFSEMIYRDIDSSDPVQTAIYPDIMESALIVASYLLFQGRNDFIAFLHPLSEKGLQQRSSLGVILDDSDVRWFGSSYIEQSAASADLSSDGSDVDKYGDLTADLEIQTIREAMIRIRSSGYRTIVISMDHPEFSLVAIAQVAEDLGMTNGNYFYFFYDQDIIYNVFDSEIVKNFLVGASFVLPVASVPLDEPFWKQLNEAQFLDSLNMLNPISDDKPGFLRAENGLFDQEDYYAEFGAEFVYDAVMAIGVGACIAARESNGSINGSSHHRGIRNSIYRGASGHVQFGRPRLSRGGARHGDLVNWAAINFIGDEVALPDIALLAELPPSAGNGSVLEQIVDSWFRLGSYTYADGSHVAPLPLREPGNQNYLNPGLRGAGLALMTLTIFAALLVTLWVYIYRKHRVLAASQPIFLYVICGGTIVEALSILTISFDESYGLNQDQLSKCCMALPWMLSCGFVIVTSSLFTKLLRVHRTLRFSRARVELKQVTWPMAVLIAATFLSLALWTALDPLVWQRKIVDVNTWESVGSCRTQGELAAFLVPLAVVLFAALCLMAFMAYKTRDVDETYSESNWILILIIIQLQVCIISAPVIIQLHSKNPNVNYLVFSMLLLSFPWTTLGFIFVPKVVAFWRAVNGIERRRKRGQRNETTQVTGITLPEETNPIGPEQVLPTNDGEAEH